MAVQDHVNTQDLSLALVSWSTQKLAFAVCKVLHQQYVCSCWTQTKGHTVHVGPLRVLPSRPCVLQCDAAHTDVFTKDWHKGVFTWGDAWPFCWADVKNSTIGFNVKF